MLNQTPCVAIFVVVAAFSAAAQTPDPKLRFEVATIKVSPPLVNGAAAGRILGVHGGPGTDQPEQLTLGARSMRNLLVQAFGIRPTQLSGPGWIGDNSYDITAKVPRGATKDEMNVMLQNLLVERLGLTFHRETRETPGYELVVSKRGKLMESSTEPAPPPVLDKDGKPVPAKFGEDRNGIPQLPPGVFRILTGQTRKIDAQYVTGQRQTLAQLASWLETLLEKPVLDKTGLTAKYDFGIAFDPMGLPGGLPFRASEIGPDVRNLFTTLDQDLGLRLEQKKVRVDLIVIDKLEKTPTEN